MYKNLEAELARRGLTRRELAQKLGITLGTMSLKLNGKANLTLPEAKKIKNCLECDKSIDYLFDDTASDNEEQFKDKQKGE